MVDDDPVDRQLILQAFTDAKAEVELHFASSGAAALKQLTAVESGRPVFRPDACIFDINMPGISGIELLQKVKRHSDLRQIPVVMLSSSDDEKDVSRCYELQASFYVCKPDNYRGLREMISGITVFWQETVSFPDRIQAVGFDGSSRG